MLTKQGQLKIKTIDGLIVAKPDLKTAIGSGAVRKYAVAKKGIRYRKIYKTKESRYMYLLEDMVCFGKTQTVERKSKIDKTDALIAGSLIGAGSGIGVGSLIAGNLGREKSPKTKTKYGIIGGTIGGIGLGTLGAYQNIRQQKRLQSNNSSSMALTMFGANDNKKKKSVRTYTVDADGKKKYLTPEEMHYEKNQRAKEELEYKQRRLDQAKAREERLQREDKRRPVDDTRKNISTAVNVSREAKGWANTGNKLFGWFG